MLNRFIQAKKDAAAPEKERRPWKASDVSEVPIAEKWRNSVIREIAKGVADIQNATLGEHAIRELNDQINKLIREKKHWETQVSATDLRQTQHTEAGITSVCCVCVRRLWIGSSGRYWHSTAAVHPAVRRMLLLPDRVASLQRPEVHSAFWLCAVAVSAQRNTATLALTRRACAPLVPSLISD